MDTIRRYETFCEHGFQVSGVRCQASYRVFTPDTSYETSYEIPPIWNSESSRRIKALNVEHRTANIERRILMTLRFIDFITSEPQPALSIAESKFEV